jgi:hypothetical protein
MKVAVALVVGYLFGSKTGGKDLDQLTRSLKSLCETEEFGDVVAAARAHAGSTLRDLAAMVEGEHGVSLVGVDLVDRVRNLVERG